MTAGIRAVHYGRRLEIVIEPATGDQAPLGLVSVRSALIEAIRSAGAEVHCILIRGAAPAVLRGPDLPQPKDRKAPVMADLTHAVETSPVPVAILLEGPVSGRGAELALAARLKLAAPTATLAFPAARLGLVQGAGAVQRLTRLIGAEQALRLLRGRRPVGAAEALALGVLDAVVEGDAADVLAAARARVDEGNCPPPSLERTEGLRDGRAFLTAVATARAGLGPEALPAERALLDCVEAAMLLPADQALSLEATLTDEVAASPEAAALCHVHRAELRALRPPEGLEGFEAEPVHSVGLAGAEPALSGLVLTALARGLAVTLADPDRARLAAFLESVAARQQAAVDAGQLAPAQRDADWARLGAVLDPAELDGCDLIIGTGTAALPPARRGRPVLVAAKGEPPEGTMRLVLAGRVAEIGVPGTSHGPVVLTAWAALRRMGLTVLVTGLQAPTGIAGRLAAAGGAAVRSLVELGVAPEAIHAALVGFGLPPPPVPDAPAGKSREMAVDEIRDRWLGAMANEAARLLQAGVTRSALDIDLVAVAGLGFPRSKGGPLHQADQRGLMILRRDLTRWAADGPLWAPVPALDALVSLGRGFAGAVRTG